MAAAIRKARPQSDVKIMPGGRGDFIVKADGKVLWNKKQQDDQFPEDQAVLAKLK